MTQVGNYLGGTTNRLLAEPEDPNPWRGMYKRMAAFVVAFLLFGANAAMADQLPETVVVDAVDGNWTEAQRPLPNLSSNKRYFVDPTEDCWAPPIARSSETAEVFLRPDGGIDARPYKAATKWSSLRFKYSYNPATGAYTERVVAKGNANVGTELVQMAVCVLRYRSVYNYETDSYSWKAQATWYVIDAVDNKASFRVPSSSCDGGYPIEVCRESYVISVAYTVSKP